MRNQSKHMVMVFDPLRDPSVGQVLKDERNHNPDVIAVAPRCTIGLVSTPTGTFWVNKEGNFCGQSVESGGCAVPFYRQLKTEGTTQRFETMPFIRAQYTLAECLACATGVHRRLDEFVDEFGATKEERFQACQAMLDKACGYDGFVDHMERRIAQVDAARSDGRVSI